MTTAVIGRILATSLYQAITEQLPLRVEFYESWLSPKGFQAARVHVSAVRAVFSFLRREDGAYDPVVRRAGALAADWLFDDLPPIRRRLMQAAPRALRVRAALSLAKELVRETWAQSSVRIRWRRETSTFTITRSLFCDMRDPAPAALCGFYAAGLEAFLRRLDLDAEVRTTACEAQGSKGCSLSVTLPGGSPGVAAVLLAAALITGGAATGAAGQAGAPEAGGRVLVMPFDNASKLPALAWLGEGVPILLTGQIEALGIAAIQRDERLKAFERFQVPPLATVSRATVIRIGELAGASDVVIGAIEREGDAVMLRARRLNLGLGWLGPESVVRGPLGSAPALAGELAAGLWPGVGDAARGAASRTGRAFPEPPMAAFEPYVKGLIADTPETAVPLFAKAIAARPDFDEARVAMARAHQSAGNYRGAIEALAPVRDASPVWADAMLLTAVAQAHLRDAAAAWHTLSTLQARAPSAIVLNGLGVIRLQSAAALAGAAPAASYFSQAHDLDPLDPDYLFNLGYACWLDGDAAAAGRWLREAVRLNPADAPAHALLARVLHAGGHEPEAARELVLAQRLSAAFDGLDLRAAPAAPPKGLARFKDDSAPPRARRPDAAFEAVGEREQREQARFYLDRGRRLVEQERDREAEAELLRALYLAPYDAEAHLLLGRSYLRTGRLREAIDAFKISIWSEDSAPARVALAEAYLEARESAAALAEVQRALVLDPGSLHAQKLLERLRRPEAAQL